MTRTPKRTPVIKIMIGEKSEINAAVLDAISVAIPLGNGISESIILKMFYRIGGVYTHRRRAIYL